MAQQAPNDESTSPEERDGETPWLEYGAAALGIVFAVGVLGTIAWEGFTGGDAPADIALDVVSITPASGGFAAEVRAHNRGTHTASEVAIEGKVGDETGETTFDFVPGGAERVGTLVFQADPGPGGITLRVLGYREP